MFPPKYRNIQTMAPNSPTMAQIGMHYAQHLAADNQLASCVVIMQSADGDVQMAGFTNGMENNVRSARHIMGVLKHAQLWCSKFLVNNLDAEGTH